MQSYDTTILSISGVTSAVRVSTVSLFTVVIFITYF